MVTVKVMVMVPALRLWGMRLKAMVLESDCHSVLYSNVTTE
jgi:hypothetical protein